MFSAYLSITARLRKSLHSIVAACDSQRILPLEIWTMQSFRLSLKLAYLYPFVCMFQTNSELIRKAWEGIIFKFSEDPSQLFTLTSLPCLCLPAQGWQLAVAPYILHRHVSADDFFFYLTPRKKDNNHNSQNVEIVPYKCTYYSVI